MNFVSRTLQQKVKGKWTVLNVVTDSVKIHSMLCEEMTVRYLLKQKRKIRKIEYTGIGIVVYFNRNMKAVYTK